MCVIVQIQMSQLYPGAKHRCQIDCTNHDEVISALELKSKDLYFFWRNYEWLYNRYYSELNEPKPEPVKQNHDECNRQIDALEQENENLLKENKRLKIELESCQRQLSDNSTFAKIQGDYRQEITVLRNKANEYQLINDKLIAENNRLSSAARAAQDDFQKEKSRLGWEHKKSLQTIVELQQVIDEMRSRSNVKPVTVHDGPSASELEEFSRRQATSVASRIRSLESEVERVVSAQFEGLRGEIDSRMFEMLSQLSQQELQSVLITVEERP